MRHDATHLLTAHRVLERPRQSQRNWQRAGQRDGQWDGWGSWRRACQKSCQRGCQRTCRQQGASMVVALIVAGVIAATSLASTDSFLLAIRALEQTLVATWQFHAAETALIACERRLIADRRGVPVGNHLADGSIDDRDPFDILAVDMGRQPEPSRWRHTDAFVGPSAEAARVQGTLTYWRLMQGQQAFDIPCLQETWIDRPDVGQVHLMTVRVRSDGLDNAGPANASARDRRNGERASVSPSASIWLQSITVSTSTRHRHFWRPVAEPPA